MTMSFAGGSNPRSDDGLSDGCMCCSEVYCKSVVTPDWFREPSMEDEAAMRQLVGNQFRLQQIKVKKSLADRVVKTAKREIECIEWKDRLDSIARFDLEEVVLGNVLGTGGFSDVFHVKTFRPKCKRSFTSEQQKARNALIAGARKSRKSPYAVKMLRESVALKPKKFLNGAVDLMMEAAYLSSFDHPNILPIRGMAAEGLDGYAEGEHDGFFVIVDRLDETLQDRIIEWRTTFKKMNRGRLRKSRERREKKKTQFLLERLLVALDIASAISYLHSKKMIFRDLKPSNIGFGQDRVAKIFDFGLARTLPDEGLHDKFHMSGCVGTYRYMAPEVRERRRYNLQADVYSFATVLSEILSLDHPLECHQPHDEETAYQLKEACICPCWPERLKNLLRRSWSHDTTKRPTMPEVCSVLRHAILELGPPRPTRGSSSRDLMAFLEDHNKMMDTAADTFSRTSMSMDKMSVASATARTA